MDFVALQFYKVFLGDVKSLQKHKSIVFPYFELFLFCSFTVAVKTDKKYIKTVRGIILPIFSSRSFLRLFPVFGFDTKSSHTWPRHLPLTIFFLFRLFFSFDYFYKFFLPSANLRFGMDTGQKWITLIFVILNLLSW